MARPSRCLTPGNAPQKLHWLPVAGDPKVVAQEIQALVDQLKPELRVAAAGSLIALMSRIEECHAIDPDDVVPVASFPYMWEYRVDDQASGIHLRLYGAEIPEYPNTIIVLHAHEKFVDGTAAEIKERQDQAMSLAAMRFIAGKSVSWGL